MEIEILSADYDCGDKRTCGSVQFEARTPHGILKFEADIGSGGDLRDGELTLDGEEVDTDWPDVGLPHYYAGRRAVERASGEVGDRIRDAVAEWCDNYRG